MHNNLKAHFMAAASSLILLCSVIAYLEKERVGVFSVIQTLVSLFMLVAGTTFVTWDAITLMRGGVPSYKNLWLTRGQYFSLVSAVILSAFALPALAIWCHASHQSRLSFVWFEAMYILLLFISAVSAGMMGAAWRDARKRIRVDGFAPPETTNETA